MLIAKFKCKHMIWHSKHNIRTLLRHGVIGQIHRFMDYYGPAHG